GDARDPPPRRSSSACPSRRQRRCRSSCSAGGSQSAGRTRTGGPRARIHPGARGRSRSPSPSRRFAFAWVPLSVERPASVQTFNRNPVLLRKSAPDHVLPSSKRSSHLHQEGAPVLRDGGIGKLRADGQSVVDVQEIAHAREVAQVLELP